MDNVFHSSKTDRWFTPPLIVDKARRVLGEIDLDPASEAAANQVIMATEYYTSDGQSKPWYGRVFCNPPGGKTGEVSNTVTFWRKMVSSRDTIVHGIFLAYSIEAMQTTQGKGFPSAGEFPFCVPSKRIRFYSPSGPGSRPSHSNMLVYVPGTEDHTPRFAAVFADLGVICNV